MLARPTGWAAQIQSAEVAKMARARKAMLKVFGVLSGALTALSVVPAVAAVPVAPSPAAEAALAAPTPSCHQPLRGVWIASVENIDWPSKPGLDPAAQRAEYTQLLDQAVRLHANAVFVQV